VVLAATLALSPGLLAQNPLGSNPGFVATGRLLGQPSDRPLEVLDLQRFRDRYCKGAFVKSKLSGYVQVYRLGKEPIVGKAVGCSNQGYELSDALAPSQPTPVRNLTVPWQEFAGIDANDPIGRSATTVVNVGGTIFFMFLGVGLALGGAERAGLLTAVGGIGGSYYLGTLLGKAPKRYVLENVGDDSPGDAAGATDGDSQ
jgi:hypothetical protein